MSMSDFKIYERREGGRAFIGIRGNVETESQVIEVLREEIGASDAMIGECIDHGCTQVVFDGGDTLRGYEIEPVYGVVPTFVCGACGLHRTPYSAGVCEWCYLTHNTEVGRCEGCGEKREIRRASAIREYWFVRCRPCNRKWDVGMVANPEYHP